MSYSMFTRIKFDQNFSIGDISGLEVPNLALQRGRFQKLLGEIIGLFLDHRKGVIKHLLIYRYFHGK